ncbi:UNVERIFIED_CONTAM: E3 ubiquitin-protein ligase rnf13 [Gekko kuhli]
MLSATQIYTILTVQLFAFLNLLPVEADILAYNFENTSRTFDDLPARFGYRLPSEGLKLELLDLCRRYKAVSSNEVVRSLIKSL